MNGGGGSVAVVLPPSMIMPATLPDRLVAEEKVVAEAMGGLLSTTSHLTSLHGGHQPHVMLTAQGGPSSGGGGDRVSQVAVPLSSPNGANGPPASPAGGGEEDASTEAKRAEDHAIPRSLSKQEEEPAASSTSKPREPETTTTHTADSEVSSSHKESSGSSSEGKPAKKRTTVTLAALKCERIIEAMDAVKNERLRKSLEARLAAAERDLDRAIDGRSKASSVASSPKRLAKSDSAQNNVAVFNAGATAANDGANAGGDHTSAISLEQQEAQGGNSMMMMTAMNPSSSSKPRTTESVKSRFKGVYGVRSIKKGSTRWTAKLLKDNVWYRDGSFTDEEEAARAVDERLRSWGRDDECNFDARGVERPAKERKSGCAKRKTPSVRRMNTAGTAVVAIPKSSSTNASQASSSSSSSSSPAHQPLLAMPGEPSLRAPPPPPPPLDMPPPPSVPAPPPQKRARLAPPCLVVSSAAAAAAETTTSAASPSATLHHVPLP